MYFERDVVVVKLEEVSRRWSKINLTRMKERKKEGGVTLVVVQHVFLLTRRCL